MICLLLFSANRAADLPPNAACSIWISAEKDEASGTKISRERRDRDEFCDYEIF